ncbi:calcium-binding protein [Pseudomonas gingeri]|uniref:calcium-binding protein n=1 Tax=Pseudomonas gingeri TaxID=117681 RepID=UPI0015A23225|nr:calcium-binding protein [Pseudomonas gingeri]NWA27921.1 calcium-binding protein [Pseudomonas gingeri]
MANTLSRDERVARPVDGMVISDLVTHPALNKPSSAPARTPSPARGRAGLAELDARLGPVTLDSFVISRVELYDMGARLRGRNLDSADPQLQGSGRALVEGLQFDPTELQQHLEAGDAANQRPIDVLFEIASQRSQQAPPLLGAEKPALAANLMKHLNQLLVRLQNLQVLTHKYVTFSLPSWIDTAKSRSLLTAGSGMQAYGIYSGLVGIREALKKRDVTEAAVNAGSIGAELTSILVERGLRKTGEALLSQGGRIFQGFRATSAGLLVSRSAGLLGNVLTLPFDIHSAVVAFNHAAKTSGKEAMDHYVTAGFSIASATLSLALGAAAAAGFSAAGPLGLVACAVLIVGAKIYSAVRQVDDIDDYIELTVNERWRSGWFAFTGQALDQEVMDRYLVERTRVDYGKALETRARALLDVEMKETLAGVVNGNFHVELEPVKHWALRWDEDEEQPFTTVNTPVVREGDDVIDASRGLEQVPGLVSGTPGEKKGLLWQLGGGNDQVIGAPDKPNYFAFSTGTKTLTGGDQDDAFLFQAQETLNTPDVSAISTLQGGDGQDTLSLQGQVQARNSLHFVGHAVDLDSGTLALRRNAADLKPVAYATLASIEHVETLAGGSSRVTGNAQANHITLQGLDDQASGGGGDDHFNLKGIESRVDGGPGKDHYRMTSTGRSVILDEDGGEPSTVELDWPMERIQSWRIVDTALIVTSLRDENGTLPSHQLIIRGVYKHDGGRQLHNDLLLFVTREGHTLKPDLPATLEGTDDRDIRVSVLILGQLPPAPQPVNGGEHSLPGNSPSGYFIARQTLRTTFQVTPDHTSSSTTLFLDYDSAEIEQVSARYQVQAKRIGAFTYLNYSEARLILRFNDQTQLTLKDWVVEGTGKPSDVGGALHTTGFDLNHGIVLVLRDGSSYQLGAPTTRYLDDQRNPGVRTVEGHGSLNRRTGNYLFRSPENQSASLKEHPQRVDFKAGGASTTYTLEGMSSTYELYPCANATIHLSTPGALAKIANASTWYIHTEASGQVITPGDIRIAGQQLWVGNIRFLLPEHDDPLQPMDLIYLVLTSGARYEVDRIFEQLLLHELDARAYADLDAIKSSLDRHQADDQLASSRVRVKGLRVISESSSSARSQSAYDAMIYDTLTQQWRTDNDEAALIAPSDLFIHSPR